MLKKLGQLHTVTFHSDFVIKTAGSFFFSVQRNHTKSCYQVKVRSEINRVVDSTSYVLVMTSSANNVLLFGRL
jgi:hypothetical protein